jgi:NAD(P)-dependent dehydrogenase (short-subunit alcohol dehydrogenase family)
MDFNFSGKTILITGASSGIGKETTIALSKLGAKCIIHGRDEQRLNETLLNCENQNLHQILSLDLKDFDSYDSAILNIPPLDGVVHSAGISPKLMILKFIKLEFLRELQDVNVNSIIILLGKLWRKNKLKDGGSVVMMSSIVSHTGVVGSLAYGISKGGINSATKILAHEFVSKKIRVNSIASGMVKTPLLETQNEAMGDDFAEKYLQHYPLGYGEVDDISSLIIFLLSERSKWITGSVYIADGGYSLK